MSEITETVLTTSSTPTAEFSSYVSNKGFHFKLWRGERMVLLGFDVDEPEADFVGFAIKVCPPNSETFSWLKNRIAFDYDKVEVTGDRQFDTNVAPLQRFRWIHFPWQPVEGVYRYQVTKMHMNSDGCLREGITLENCIALSTVTYDKVVDIGFTRNFASSQAYREQFSNNADIIPHNADDGLNFKLLDLKNSRGETVYDWLGFEAKALIDNFIQEVLDNPDLHLDIMAYDLNLPDLVSKLVTVGQRLHAVIDNSSRKEDGVLHGHTAQDSSESIAAAKLTEAGAQVRRTDFKRLQHHKILIQRNKQNQAVKVLCGSTNFSFRGLYIQANNVLVFNSEAVAALFGQMFEAAFNEPEKFSNSPLSQEIFTIKQEDGSGPSINISFSPHKSAHLALKPLVEAINTATSSVFYSVAFLYQMRNAPLKLALEGLPGKNIFSYGSVDKPGKLKVVKPDGSLAIADFEYLAKKAPEPFRTEWSGGSGINIHHKFVVTDFNLASAKVFTGSSNLSASGEKSNGDHLIMIEDQRIATAYVIEAIRIFDHLQFRHRMQDATSPQVIKLLKPTAISGQPTWFTRFYEDGSSANNDRLLFSH